VKNAGLETMLNADVFDLGVAKLSATLSYTANGNKLVALGRDVPSIVFTPQVHRAGYPLGAFFARKITSYKDINGDGLISRVNCPSYGGVANPQLATGPACEIVLADTESYAGSPLPTREASFSSTLTLYRNVRLTTLFDYRGGYKQFNATAEFRCNTIQNCREINDKSAPLADQARALASRMGTFSGYIEDGSFVKLRELAVTFVAPRQYAARIGADALSLTVAGRNLYTWTNYGGFDPEVNSGTSSAAFGSFGQLDFLTQPPVRTIVTRLSLNF
jgi:hypothetical protein